MSFRQGTTLLLSCTVKSGAVLVDPTTVTATVRKPDTTTATPPVTQAGVGTYNAQIVVDQPGRWVYQWTTAGNSANGVQESWFYVTPTEIP